MTLVSHIRLNKTELHTRQLLYENAYGIRFDSSTNMLDIVLDNEHTVKVNNFIMISTDSSILMEIVKETTVEIDVSGIFMAYSKLGTIRLKRSPAISRVPKITLIYA